MSERRKLAVVLASNANDDKSSVGFTIADAALSTGIRGRGLPDLGRNYDRVIVTGAGPLIEWVQAGATTICL